MPKSRYSKGSKNKKMSSKKYKKGGSKKPKGRGYVGGGRAYK